MGSEKDLEKKLSHEFKLIFSELLKSKEVIRLIEIKLKEDYPIILPQLIEWGLVKGNKKTSCEKIDNNVYNLTIDYVSNHQNYMNYLYKINAARRRFLEFFIKKERGEKSQYVYNFETVKKLRIIVKDKISKSKANTNNRKSSTKEIEHINDEEFISYFKNWKKSIEELWLHYYAVDFKKEITDSNEEYSSKLNYFHDYVINIDNYKKTFFPNRDVAITLYDGIYCLNFLKILNNNEKLQKNWKKKSWD